jgi:Helicase conserved C-terminal domain
VSAPAFLGDLELRTVPLPDGTPFHLVGLALGQGASALEVLVVTGDEPPRPKRLRTLWKERNKGRAAPLTADYPPYLIFLAVLRELYGEELAEELEDQGPIPITTIQKHGVEELLADPGNTKPAAGYDEARLNSAVKTDRFLLAELSEQAASVKPESDPKLAALVNELVKIAKEAASESVDEADRRRKRKVLVFSFYEDTIDYIEEHLVNVIATDARLADYRGWVASVAGTDSRHGISREHAIQGFAPDSARAPAAKPGAERDCLDLPFTTDVLAEGLNLQDCRNIINYDLPWNPMRLVQRHGRIDRIGSPHPRVFLRTFFPDAQLDHLLDLELRVRRKLAQAAASVGAEAAPIEYGAEGNQSFAETREEIERLAQNDPTLYEQGGTATAAQSGEEYRQELRKALEKEPWKTLLRELCWKAGSGIVKGKRRGHFFCARIGERIYLRFVPTDGGTLIHEIGTCLRSRLQQCLDAIEAPCTRREENLLRTVFQQDHANNGARARAVVETVEKIGLEPFHAPAPLAPIRQEEIHLICWLAIERKPDADGGLA